MTWVRDDGGLHRSKVHIYSAGLCEELEVVCERKAKVKDGAETSG